MSLLVCVQSVKLALSSKPNGSIAAAETRHVSEAAARPIKTDFKVE
jgi:hypothetical protein